jgi:hypothetical protein
VVSRRHGDVSRLFLLTIMSGPFISPVKPVDTAVPWNWNPAATFIAARNDAIAQRQQEEQLVLDRELQSILMPLKIEEAKLNLEKLKSSVELQRAQASRYREALPGITQQAIQGGQGSAYDLGVDLDAEDAEDAPTSGGMNLNGFGSVDAGTPPSDNLLVAMANEPEQSANLLSSLNPPPAVSPRITQEGQGRFVSAQPDPTQEERFNVLADTDWPPESMLADAGGGVSDSPTLSDQTRQSVMEAANRTLAGAGAKPFDLSAEASGLKANQAPAPRVTIEDPAQQQAAVPSLQKLQQALNARQALKMRHEGVQSEKGSKFLETRVNDRRDWVQSTFNTLNKTGKYGISDLKTLEDLTDLPGDQRARVMQLAQQDIAAKRMPLWSDYIASVTGKAGTSTDKKTTALETLKYIDSASADGQVPASLAPLKAKLEKELADSHGVTAPTPLDGFRTVMEDRNRLLQLKQSVLPRVHFNGEFLTPDQIDVKLADLDAIAASTENDPAFLQTLPKIDATSMSNEGIKQALESNGGFGLVVYGPQNSVVVTPYGKGKLKEAASKGEEEQQATRGYGLDGAGAARLARDVVVGTAQGIRNANNYVAGNIYDAVTGKKVFGVPTESAAKWVEDFTDELRGRKAK